MFYAHVLFLIFRRRLSPLFVRFILNRGSTYACFYDPSFQAKNFLCVLQIGPERGSAEQQKKCKVIRKKIMNTLIMQVEWAQPIYSFSSEKTGDHLRAELFAEPFAVHLAQLKLNHCSRLAKMGWQMNCRHNSCARNQNCLSIAT